MYCTLCQNYTTNAKFCSRSCAVTFNNTHQPKRKRGHKCKKCDALVLSTTKYCDKCTPRKIIINGKTTSLSRDSLLSLTKAEAITEDTQKYRRIRSHAKHLASLLGITARCKVCNYSLYVETCHIKPISSYSSDTLVSVINNPSNLVGLCPTHHWEFDHGYITL
jgi:hypothetical protein